jgi:excinuclease ABC subunit A
MFKLILNVEGKFAIILNIYVLLNFVMMTYKIVKRRRRLYAFSKLKVAPVMDPKTISMPNDKSKINNFTGYVQVRGARENNLKNVDLDIPRDALVVFTGVSGSGKSSLAFGTLYAEAQRRYLESVSPYARRLFNQMAIPEVDEIEGLPPAVALQQQRGSASTRSSVGSVTTLSNLLRMLYSRAGNYPDGQEILYAESFSANTPEGACPECHGLGRVYEVTEKSMVPDANLTIRERAIAAWPTAWGGQNQRDILITLGYDVDVPWKDIPQKTRDYILFTDEQPVVPVYPGLNVAQVKKAIQNKIPPDYMGTFTGVKRHVLHTFANTQSQLMKKRVAQYMLSSDCPVCNGKRLRKESLSVTFAGLDIADIAREPLESLATIFAPFTKIKTSLSKSDREHPEKLMVTQRIAEDLMARLAVMLDLGLGYLTLERSTPTLSPGELQRLRLATQVRSNLFGVVYVLDEPSAGLHPADTEALLRALDRLKASGNSLFVVEHEIDVIKHADWIVDVGPAAGEKGGYVLYSGPPEGLKDVEASVTRQFIYNDTHKQLETPALPKGWLKLEGVSRNNLNKVAVEFPLGVLTSVTGVSGSGKSSLVSQVLVELVAARLGMSIDINTEEEDTNPLEQTTVTTLGGSITDGMQFVKRLVVVDQKPIGRTPRSNLATYTGLFDHIRKLFAGTKLAKSRKYDAGRFSFNVAKGRCPHCQGEGFVMVELLFLPSVYAPCPTCHGARYNPQTLEIKYNNKNVAEVLAMTVDDAWEFFNEAPQIHHALNVIREVGLGYLRLGQPATELSGGEAQRIKLATELQRTQNGNTLYILDEPTTGLHPSDVEKLLLQLNGLVKSGNTIIVVEHDMHVIASSDWVIDIGPGAGNKGGNVVAKGIPADVAKSKKSSTAPYLDKYIKERSGL